MRRLKQVLPLLVIPMVSVITLKLGKAWFRPSFRWWLLGVVLAAFAAVYLLYRRSMASLARQVERLDSPTQAAVLGLLKPEVQHVVSQSLTSDTVSGRRCP